MPLNVLLDLDQVPLVARGERDRARLARVPSSGETVTMLCGYTDSVEYADLTTGFVGIRTCWTCDLAYRRQLGHLVPAGHPGLRGRSAPA